MKIIRQKKLAMSLRARRSLPAAVSTKAGNLFTLIVLVFIFAAGASAAASKSPAADINTPTGMSAYLKNRQLPALKAIDLWESQFGTGLKLTTAHYEIYTTLLDPLPAFLVPHVSFQ